MKYRTDFMEDSMDKMEKIENRKFEGNIGMYGEMTSERRNSSGISGYAVGEMENLFREWLSSFEDEVVTFAENRSEINVDEISKHFKISRESANSILKKLEQRKRVNADSH